MHSFKTCKTIIFKYNQQIHYTNYFLFICHSETGYINTQNDKEKQFDNNMQSEKYK